MTPGHPRSWNFVGELSSEQPAYPIDRGKIIGGSSAINGTVFIRGRQIDFDNWAALGHQLWSFEQVLPYFKKSETDLNFAGEFHGQDGPMPANRPLDEDARPVAEAFTEACIAAGFPEQPDKNTPGVEGVGPIPRNVHYGIRMNTAMTYLTRSVRSRENLTVLCDTLVRRVLFEGTRAVGVETERDGQPVSFSAGEVILCAGGIKSPHLLMLSGIGPEETLRVYPDSWAHCRTAKQDLEIDGTTIKQDDFVMAVFASANRDEDAYERPEEYDITRSFEHDHLGFGHGEHSCPGALLTRVDAGVIIERLMARFPNWELTGTPQRWATPFLQGMRSLPLAFST